MPAAGPVSCFSSNSLVSSMSVCSCEIAVFSAFAIHFASHPPPSFLLTFTCSQHFILASATSSLTPSICYCHCYCPYCHCYCQHDATAATAAGCRWLDLFAGTGSVGLEALSRGAGSTHFVEADGWVVKNVLGANIRTCGFNRQSVVHTAKVCSVCVAVDWPASGLHACVCFSARDVCVLSRSLWLSPVSHCLDTLSAQHLQVWLTKAVHMLGCIGASSIQVCYAVQVLLSLFMKRHMSWPHAKHKTLDCSQVEDWLRKAIELPRFAGGAFDFISMCPPYLLVSYPELFDLLQQASLIHDRTIMFVEYPKQLSRQVGAACKDWVHVVLQYFCPPVEIACRLFS